MCWRKRRGKEMGALQLVDHSESEKAVTVNFKAGQTSSAGASVMNPAEAAKYLEKRQQVDNVSAKNMVVNFKSGPSCDDDRL